MGMGAWKYFVIRSMCCDQAEEAGHKGATAEEGPWLFTLDLPSYQPVLLHAKNRCVLGSNVTCNQFPLM